MTAIAASAAGRCDSIFACDLDESVGKLGLQLLKTPPRNPTTNAICERG
ncbi:MAG: hypothetical protein ACREV7_18710 [Steroidobacteraceae bacterium]